MKTFLFAGHDTTSTTVAYGYLMLSLHPEALAKARAELDTVFGTDSRKMGELIKANLNLANNFPSLNELIPERFLPPLDNF